MLHCIVYVMYVVRCYTALCDSHYIVHYIVTLCCNNNNNWFIKSHGRKTELQDFYKYELKRNLQIGYYNHINN